MEVENFKKNGFQKFGVQDIREKFVVRKVEEIEGLKNQIQVY